MGRPTWSGWLLGVVSGGVLLIVVALAVIYSGLFNVAASTPHRMSIAWAAHTTMKHAVRARAGGIEAPQAFTPAQVQRGFEVYNEHCVACHGGPATARAEWASAMTPTPPFLLDAARKWSPAELYWIVHNGVKMTAMPAWGEIEEDQDIWAVVAFLESMPQTPPARFVLLRRAADAQTKARSTAQQSVRPPG